MTSEQDTTDIKKESVLWSSYNTFEQRVTAEWCLDK